MNNIKTAEYMPCEAEVLADRLLQSIAFKVYSSDDDLIRAAAAMLRRLGMTHPSETATPPERVEVTQADRRPKCIRCGALYDVGLGGSGWYHTCFITSDPATLAATIARLREERDRARRVLRSARQAIVKAVQDLQASWGDDEGDAPELLDAIVKIDAALAPDQGEG